MLTQGRLPDGITYSALVSACGKGALRQGASQLSETILRQGLLPDGITYNALVKCLREGCAAVESP